MFMYNSNIGDYFDGSNLHLYSFNFSPFNRKHFLELLEIQFGLNKGALSVCNQMSGSQRCKRIN